MLLIFGLHQKKEFLTESRAKTLHVKSLLQNTKNNDLSIHAYFVKMKSFVESLSATGVVVTDEELLNYIIDGLESEFDVAVVNITTRLESKLDLISVQEVQIILQKFELRLEKANVMMNFVVNTEFHGITANIANLSSDIATKKSQSEQPQCSIGQSQFNTMQAHVPQPQNVTT